MRRRIFTLAWLVIGVGLLAIAFNISQSAKTAWVLNESAKTWPTTDATITKLDIVKKLRYVKHGNTGEFKEISYHHGLYKYVVDGKEYTSDHITANRNTSINLMDCKVGDVMTVHYNPKNPEQVLASTKGFNLIDEALSDLSLALVGLLVLGLAHFRFDPVAEFAEGSSSAYGGLPEIEIEERSAEEANRDIGNSVKEFTIFVVVVTMLFVGLTIWRTDFKLKNWVESKATVTGYGNDKQSSVGLLDIKMNIEGHAVNRQMVAVVSEGTGVDKIYPIGTELSVKYNPQRTRQVVRAETSFDSIVRDKGYVILGIGSLVVIFLCFADPRMFSLGLGKRYRRYADPNMRDFYC